MHFNHIFFNLSPLSSLHGGCISLMHGITRCLIHVYCHCKKNSRGQLKLNKVDFTQSRYSSVKDWHQLVIPRTTWWLQGPPQSTGLNQIMVQVGYPIMLIQQCYQRGNWGSVHLPGNHPRLLPTNLLQAWTFGNNIVFWGR